jgi:hypothetical protein
MPRIVGKALKPKIPKKRSPGALRVLMIASEAQPYSKTGGLADVAAALPKALGRLGHDVTLVTPRYRGVADGPVVANVSIEVAAHRFNTRLMEGGRLREDASTSANATADRSARQA